MCRSRWLVRCHVVRDDATGACYVGPVYATCLFCSGALGRNESLEHFPVGRRLAFDAAKGRLWVVCPSCRRWNLSPLEIRWEAIEEAERAYRGTRLRASTEHIGLAKLKEGTELVRIGRPLLPEFAAWRYGSEFRSRHRKAILLGSALVVSQLTPLGLKLVVGGGMLVAGGAAYSAVSFAGSASVFAKLAYDIRASRRLRATVRDEDGQHYRIASSSASASAIQANGAKDTWSPHLNYKTRWRDRLFWRSLAHGDPYAKDPGQVELFGDHAVRALAAILPAVNKDGSGKRAVNDAVEILLQADSPTQLLSTRAVGGAQPLLRNGMNMLGALPPSIRLALEMALHEADERRALDGELQALEDRWREAEEVAAIADSMFYPPSLDERLHSLREPPRSPDLP